MIQEIIGRKEEKQILQDCFESNNPEFVAVYGRRRIGKTFLVKQFFKEKFDFASRWMIYAIVNSFAVIPRIIRSNGKSSIS